MQRFKYLALGITCFLLGGALLQPAVAHYVAKKDAHTLAKHHASYYASRAWTKKYFYTKGQTNSTFLSQSNAASTYLTQASAFSTYLPIDGTVSATGTITAPDFAYSSNKTKYLLISSAALRPTGTLVLNGTGENGGSVFGESGSGACQIPVILPDGAVIKRFRSYFYDNDNPGQVLAQIQRHSLTSGDWVALGNAHSPIDTAGYSYTESSNIYEIVDNNGEYYIILVSFGANLSSLRLKAIRVEYEMPSP